MKILSIDPGFSFTGWAIIDKEDSRATLVKYGVLKFKKSLSIANKLYELYFILFDMISVNNITHMALETPFLGKNAATFLKLGYIRGILYLLSQIHRLTVSEFSPKEVKLLVTGYGDSDKEAVCRAVMKLFKGLEQPEKYDITDAIAIGLSCLKSL